MEGNEEGKGVNNENTLDSVVFQSLIKWKLVWLGIVRVKIVEKPKDFELKANFWLDLPLMLRLNEGRKALYMGDLCFNQEFSKAVKCFRLSS